MPIQTVPRTRPQRSPPWTPPEAGRGLENILSSPWTDLFMLRSALMGIGYQVTRVSNQGTYLDRYSNQEIETQQWQIQGPEGTRFFTVSIQRPPEGGEGTEIARIQPYEETLEGQAGLATAMSNRQQQQRPADISQYGVSPTAAAQGIAPWDVAGIRQARGLPRPTYKEEGEGGTGFVGAAPELRPPMAGDWFGIAPWMYDNPERLDPLKARMSRALKGNYSPQEWERMPPWAKANLYSFQTDYMGVPWESYTPVASMPQTPARQTYRRLKRFK